VEQDRLIAFKTIETPYVSDYERVFPEMRFIHIIRDPITTYASLKRTRVGRKHLPFYADGDHLQTLLDARWLPHARSIRERVEAEPDRHVLIRYEDLSADASTAVRRLCDWLGVEAPDEPDQQTTLGGRSVTELPLNPSGVDATPVGVVSDMAQLFGYEDVLTRRERALIGHCTAPLGTALGYPGRRRNRFTLWLSWLLPDRDERLNRSSRLRWLLAVAKRRAYITQLLGRRSSATP
jgi:hypothetical protein